MRSPHPRLKTKESRAHINPGSTPIIADLHLLCPSDLLLQLSVESKPVILKLWNQTRVVHSLRMQTLCLKQLQLGPAVLNEPLQLLTGKGEENERGKKDKKTNKDGLFITCTQPWTPIFLSLYIYTIPFSAMVTSPSRPSSWGLRNGNKAQHKSITAVQ